MTIFLKIHKHKKIVGIDKNAFLKEILFLRERLNTLLAEHTGQSLEVIGRDTERDRFMSSEQSVEYGLVDEVINSR